MTAQTDNIDRATQKPCPACGHAHPRNALCIGIAVGAGGGVVRLSPAAHSSDNIDHTSHSYQLGTAQVRIAELETDIGRMRSYIAWAMGRLDPLSKSEDTRMAYDWLRKAMTGTEG